MPGEPAHAEAYQLCDSSTAAPTIPAVTIGLDLTDKNLHWCALDQAGNVSGRSQLRLTRVELHKHFSAIPPARIALEVAGQAA